MDPKKYIEKMAQSYEQMFGKKLGRKPYSPLDEGDHPELDTSEFLSEDDMENFSDISPIKATAMTSCPYPAATTICNFYEPDNNNFRRCMPLLQSAG